MNNYTIMIMTILVLALIAVFDRNHHASRLVALALILTFSLAVPARAGDWRTGYVPSGGGDTSAIVVFNNTNKNAYIRLHAYVQKGLIPRSAESDPEGKEGNIFRNTKAQQQSIRLGLSEYKEEVLCFRMD